jgi:hypothetical protein
MAWTNKSKTSTEFEITYILTHDGNQILAGASEDKILISQDEETMWGKKSKTSSVWTNKTKSV